MPTLLLDNALSGLTTERATREADSLLALWKLGIKGVSIGADSYGASIRKPERVFWLMMISRYVVLHICVVAEEYSSEVAVAVGEQWNRMECR